MLIAILTSSSTSSVSDLRIWSQFSSCFVGLFSGTHRGAGFLAGGANIPDKICWDGGRVLNDCEYILEAIDEKRKDVGKFPWLLGYCVSI